MNVYTYIYMYIAWLGLNKNHGLHSKAPAVEGYALAPRDRVSWVLVSSWHGCCEPTARTGPEPLRPRPVWTPKALTHEPCQ